MSLRALMVSSSLLVAVAAQDVQPALVDLLRLDARWHTCEVGDGVVLRGRAFPALFGARQHLTVLTIDPHTRARFDVDAPQRRTRTSAIAAANGALAGINGGYFDIRGTGRSLGLLRLDGALVVPAEPRQPSVGVTAGGGLALATRSAGDWPEMHEALGAGPMLLARGKVLPIPERLRAARHPRSAVGVAADGTVHLLAIDGRAQQAAGTTLGETAQVLAALGCADALNLDGGGSTTLWVAGRGVCNHPCDDGKFDAAGERAVANALLVHAPAVVVLDDDDAELAGDGWRQRTGGDDVHGADFASTDAANASATFRVALPFAGRWHVAGRRPAAATAAGAWRVAIGGAASAPAPAPAPARPLAPGAWHVVGALDAPAGERVAVALTAASGPLVVDALRFVQVLPAGQPAPRDRGK